MSSLVLFFFISPVTPPNALQIAQRSPFYRYPSFLLHPILHREPSSLPSLLILTYDQNPSSAPPPWHPPSPPNFPVEKRHIRLFHPSKTQKIALTDIVGSGGGRAGRRWTVSSRMGACVVRKGGKIGGLGDGITVWDQTWKLKPLCFAFQRRPAWTATSFDAMDSPRPSRPSAPQPPIPRSLYLVPIPVSKPRPSKFLFTPYSKLQCPVSPWAQSRREAQVDPTATVGELGGLRALGFRSTMAPIVLGIGVE